ncbi:hypothetical protein HPB49_021820 [Dermacentor silvarum]|uniref:Uncharacterized protein n=1 Tax=Dermacentor silvarum TaxID=543639 RepID=A0ACB8CHI9_DERSI|nr:hypothetical protein HPB49_021820 [Dermacentor silvarum]
MQSLTKETYEATIMTTRSTVGVVEYMLTDLGDPVESVFSCFRQFNGGNDRVDARAAVFTAEKLLKVGILQAASTGNAPSSSECKTALKGWNHDGDREDPAIPDAALAVLWKLQHVMKHDEVPPHLEFAPLTYMAGYLAFVCEQKNYGGGLPACRESAVMFGRSFKVGLLIPGVLGGGSSPPLLSCIVARLLVWSRGRFPTCKLASPGGGGGGRSRIRWALFFTVRHGYSALHLLLLFSGDGLVDVLPL